MNPFRFQSGVVFAISLFMLALLTVIGIAAMKLSTTHYRLVGNLQEATELEMGARAAIEKYVSETAEISCQDPSHPLQLSIAMDDNRSFTYTIATRCVGRSLSGAEGELTDPLSDAHWDISATPSGVGGACLTLHMGLVIAGADECPLCPSFTPLCN